ncbi:hypothetical protein [Kineococcus rhizosphaerae]|uniref:Uncharacterized protein n=1 Tax=Kineococcus rhizosphaerae TaxID=559628 RepID=A0A2T0R8C4_9ACTN|nr:hypothetical protein [Kineococcus rhizosphaerae]PRY17417.1 hypothetical protein CLV37_102380 [Kineococcus rhizosphaerae]
MRTAPALDAACTRGLARWRACPGVDPRDVDASGAELADVLAPLARSAWPEVAWRCGVLTATGYPVELAWASRDAAVRWTCEVAGPEAPQAGRLERAGQLAGVDVAAWGAAQRGGPLRYGAWLGVRWLAGARRAKVYAELPTGTLPPGSWTPAARDLARAVLDLTWRMAGVNDDGSVELYARVPEPSWAQLRAVSATVGDTGALVAGVRGLLGERGEHLPRPSGLSLAVSPAGVPLALTWFTVAARVWSRDGSVGRSLERVVPALRAGSYPALAAGPADGRWRHGVVGAGVDAAGRTWFQAGLRPT